MSNVEHLAEGVTLHLGDCLEVLDSLPENSIDAVVTDPPYELANDGKQSANRIFLEVAFPKHSYIDAKFSGRNELSALIGKVLGLSGGGRVPRPATAMPIVPVAFNGDVPSGNQNVNNKCKSSVIVSDSGACSDVEAYGTEHIGCFALKLGNAEAVLDFLNGSGSGFFSGGVGVGFGVSASSFPSFLSRFRPVPLRNDDVGLGDDALSELVSAFRGTEDRPVFRLHVGRASDENLSADGARLLCALLICSGSQFVRAGATACRLPAMLQSRRISVIDDAANRAFSFDLVVHPQDINTKGFMGKEWDGSKVAFDVSLWAKVMRVLKPGGYLLAFGATKNYHRLACAIEDAGFEIRDCISHLHEGPLLWIQGQGFPKSHDIAKAIDGVLGKQAKGFKFKGGDLPTNGGSEFRSDHPDYVPYAPATEAARQWQGWGTALKPAVEFICVGRKPLSECTVAANVLRWGTGAINIDATRVEISEADRDELNSKASKNPTGRTAENVPFVQGIASKPNALGRWPANLCHSGEQGVLDLFPHSNPGKPSDKPRGRRPGGFGNVGHEKGDCVPNGPQYGDGGSAARFFYCAKASKHDRAGSKHPTVKPINLMRWLVRMVTPPGGTVLDPFAGSGTTGVAAVNEGFNIIMVEKEEEYQRDIRSRFNDGQK